MFVILAMMACTSEMDNKPAAQVNVVVEKGMLLKQSSKSGYSKADASKEVSKGKHSLLLIPAKWSGWGQSYRRSFWWI